MHSIDSKYFRWAAAALMAVVMGACSGQDGDSESGAEDVLAIDGEFAVAPTVTPLPQSVSADTTEAQLELFNGIWNLINENYAYDDFNGVDWRDVQKIYRTQIEDGLTEENFHNAIAALLSELDDANSVYLTPKEVAELEVGRLSLAEEGYIGTMVGVPDDVREQLVILDVFSGSPAEQAGVQPHDVIIGVNGEPIPADADADILQDIRGEIGTEVTLTVSSQSEGVRDATIVRGPLNATTEITSTTLGPDNNIGYIFVPLSNEEATTGSLVSNELRALRNEDNIESLILDLRIARVSSAWPVDELLGLFVHGDAYQLYNISEEITVSVTGKDISGSQELPLVVLIGHDTVGPSEVFAGALQSLGRATIVGGMTNGRVERLALIDLTSGSRLIWPSLTARSLEGDIWGRIGIVPDVEIDLLWEEFSATVDPQLDAAIDLLSE